MLHNSRHHKGKDSPVFQKQLKILKKAIEIATEDGLTSKLDQIKSNMEKATTALELSNILNRNFSDNIIDRAKKSTK
jgi:hypothetical protein